MQQTELQWGPEARAVIASGPRVAERFLLEELDRILDRNPLALLGEPVRLVVPSKSFRRHLLERLVDRRGRAIAGLDCVTHHGLASRIAETAGAGGLASVDLLPLVARRLARRERSLAATLDDLDDGYAAILTSVMDLLDAGLDEAHVEALVEALEVEGPEVATRLEVERAQALLRIAAQASRRLAASGAGRNSHLLALAAELVQRAPEVLPSTTVLVYGYNDATGLTTDLLLALLKNYGGLMVLEDPSDPADPETPDPGRRFARNFRAHVETAVPIERLAERPPESTLALFEAGGTEAEVREVARRVQRLVTAGVRPERIGVVVRQLEPYRRALRVELDRLAVPFSGVARSGPLDPRALGLTGLLDLLKHRERTPIERWLDAAGLRGAERVDLETGLNSLGVARLEEAARLEPERYVHAAGLPLPVRTGLRAGAPESGKSGRARSGAGRRYLATERLSAACAQAARLLERFDAWASAKRFEEHSGHLDAMLRDDLNRTEADNPEAHTPGGEVDSGIAAAIGAFVASVPAETRLDFGEFTRLAAAELRSFGATELGGSGAGVQVLDVTEARSRTFEHLFVLGMNRGVFPRVVKEDPLLPDRLRDVLGRHGHGVLPDLHRKLSGFDEERYLFAQLLGSSPAVTLSWLDVDDEQNLRTPSPLVERLRCSPGPAARSPAGSADDAAAAEGESALPVERAPGLLPPDAADGELPASAVERALSEGLYGGRERFAAVLPLAFAENRADGRAGAAAEHDTRALAAARVRLLDEYDPVRGTEAGEAAYARLGPFFGLVGAASAEADPRHGGRLFVTTLEAIARCPWRTFLERLLRLEPLPDALEALPAVSPLLIGNLVHRTLDSIANTGLERRIDSVEDARSIEGTRLGWPSGDELESHLRRAAKALAFDEGIALAGFDRVLADVARAYLDAALETDWLEAGPGERPASRFPVVASEIYGRLDWPEPAAEIAFKADRLDRNGDRLLFTDYKTGKGLRGPRYQTQTRRLLIDGVRAGELLQAALYARAGGGEEDAGRYLFLNPLLPPDREREVLVRANDDEIAALVDRAVAATLGAWREGAFFPRLAEPDRNAEPVLCRYCDVAEACLRGDSTQRGRIRGWVERLRDGVTAADEDGTRAGRDRAATATWYLADPSFEA